jgi:hypothetical protein
MLYMGENKLSVSMHSSDQVHSNLTWQVESNCMLNMGKQVESNMHSSDQVNSNLTWQVEASCMLEQTCIRINKFKSRQNRTTYRSKWHFTRVRYEFGTNMHPIDRT